MNQLISHDKDPLGKALLAYMDGKEDATLQVYPDIGDSDILSARYLMRSAEDWPEVERRAVEACRGKVLDIGAGAGSHVLALQERGLEVTALDVSPGAVAVMQRRGVKRALLQNVWSFSDEKFDTLLLLMNGIGIVGDLKGLADFLDHLKHLLAPGGHILMDSSDIAYLFQEMGTKLPVWESRESYYGLAKFYMQYEETTGSVFPWLYVDYLLLEQIAGEKGYVAEKLYEDAHYHYLARLSLGNEDILSLSSVET